MGKHDSASAAGRPSGPEPFTLVIFGASGDLTRRKLVPAVYSLFREGLLPKGFRVVGFARRPKSDEAFREELREGVATHARVGLGDDWTAFAANLHYFQGDYQDPASFAALRQRLDDLAGDAPRNCLFYLATPPTVFETIAEHLDGAGLADESKGWSRLIVEKPFGHSATTSRRRAS